MSSIDDIPPESQLLNFVEQWEISTRRNVDDLAFFRQRFEEVFWVDIRGHSDGSFMAWANQRGGATVDDLLRLSRHCANLTEATKTVEAGGQLLHVSHELLEMLHKALANFILPTGNRDRKKQNLGDAFIAFRTQLRNLVQPISQDDATPEQVESRDVESQAESARVEEELSGQQLQLFRFLARPLPKINFTSYQTLREKHEFWKAADSTNDDTVFEALKRLQKKLSDIHGSGFQLENKRKEGRTRLVRDLTDQGRGRTRG